MRKPIWPRKKPLPAFTSYAQEVAFLNGHDLTAVLKEGDWESGPAPRRRDPVATTMDVAAIRRSIADAQRAVRRYRSRGDEPRATSSPIGKVVLPVDTTTPRCAKNELRVPWVLELTLFKGVVTCVHMVMESGPFGKLGMIRGATSDFFVRSLDEQIAGIERDGREARGNATVCVTLAAGHLGFRCGYAKIRQSYVVPRRTYDALLNLFHRGRKRLHSAAGPKPRRRRAHESSGRKGG